MQSKLKTRFIYMDLCKQGSKFMRTSSIIKLEFIIMLQVILKEAMQLKSLDGEIKMGKLTGFVLILGVQNGVTTGTLRLSKVNVELMTQYGHVHLK